MKYIDIFRCFDGINMLLPFVLLGCLIWKYKSTGDKGFLFLILALVLWPFCDALLGSLQDVYWRRALAGEKITLFPFSLMSDESGMTGLGFRCFLFQRIRLLVGQLLLLVAILMLARGSKKTRTEKS